MSADLLRRAADRLDFVVDGLTTDTERWDEAFPTDRVYGDHSTYERIIMHPGIGKALATWLRAEAIDADAYGDQSQQWWDNVFGEALAVAREILGEDA